MSFDRNALAQALACHGVVTRVVVASVEGSAPREVGASMLVWADGQSGTIGGGALEFEATRWAREGAFMRRVPLGPAMGQCCGGAVTLVGERYSRTELEKIDGYVLRRVDGSADLPLTLRRKISQFRNSGDVGCPQLANGWFLEPLSNPTHPIWIYGAGHVGRAIVGVLAPLPEVSITWVDTCPTRFPDDIPQNVSPLVAVEPSRVVHLAPPQADHLVLTYSHALDLEICHALLGHAFKHAGVIGSATKWARFRKRLAVLGHGKDQIDRINCPIGNPAFGKHPQAIAVSIAADLLSGESAVARALGETA